MGILSERKIGFTSKAVTNDTFIVADFEGDEAIGELYTFEITLLSIEPDLDYESIMHSQAQLTIAYSKNKSVSYNGIVSSFRHEHMHNDYYVYVAEMRPKLWWLTQSNYYQVFLRMSIVDIIKDVLGQGGLESSDYEIQIKDEKKPFVNDVLAFTCQYNESFYHFIKRKMEKFGLYYYFEQGKHGEKVIITNFKESHKKNSHNHVMLYHERSGMELENIHEVVQHVLCNVNKMPHKVVYHDYNHETPSKNIHHEAQISSKDHGVFMSFNDRTRNSDEAQSFANVQKESRVCREYEYIFKTHIPYISPGYIYTLHNYYRKNMNCDYLVTKVHHSGSQTHYLNDGMNQDSAKNRQKHFYSNKASFILSDVQFRLKQDTERTKVKGALSAVIDGDNNGYPLINKEGDYYVIFPFDVKDKLGQCKGSVPLRMAQPTAGENKGMHFPLAKGTEVLVDFIGGDPDRPYITAAIPNIHHTSPVVDKNNTQNILRTKQNSELFIEDLQGKEQMALNVPTHNSFITAGYFQNYKGSTASGLHMSAPNHQMNIDQDSDTQVKGNKGEKISGNHKQRIVGLTNVHRTGTLTENNDGGKDEKAPFYNWEGMNFKLKASVLNWSNTYLLKWDYSTTYFAQNVLKQSTGVVKHDLWAMGSKHVGLDFKNVGAVIDTYSSKFENGALKSFVNASHFSSMALKIHKGAIKNDAAQIKILEDKVKKWNGLVDSEQITIKQWQANVAKLNGMVVI